MRNGTIIEKGGKKWIWSNGCFWIYIEKSREELRVLIKQELNNMSFSLGYTGDQIPLN